MVWLAPRALEDSVRPRRPAGVVVRPLNFTVRRLAMALLAYPKSTVGLRSGDFCFVPRTDGRAALFVYLYPQGNARNYFFGALAKELLAAPSPGLIPPHISLTQQALLHIKCFEQNQTPVAGNILDRIDASLVASMRSQAHSHGVGTTTRVWGYRIILKRANDLAA